MASVADRDRLLRNDSSLKELCISLTSFANIAESIEALRVTSCPIRDVRVAVSCDFDARCRRTSNINWAAHAGAAESAARSYRGQNLTKTLFRTLGSQLTQLKSLTIHSESRVLHPVVPIDWITEALRSLNQWGNLERLDLNNLELVYDTKLTRRHQQSIHKESTPQLFLEDFMDTLRHHPSLIEAMFCRSRFRQNDTNATGTNVESSDVVFPIQQLCAALATIKSLQSIEISHLICQSITADTTITRSTLADLVCNTQNLQQLELANLEIYDRHLEGLAQRLITTPLRNTPCSQGLQELRLTCRRLGLRGCQALGLILREASSLSSQSLASSLQLVNVRIHPFDSHRITSLNIQSTNALANGLTPVANNNTNALLRRRPCLQHFILDGVKVNNMKAFKKMMRVNCVLEILHVTAIESAQIKWDERELQYLLKLNTAGRYHLLHPEVYSAYRSSVSTLVNGRTQQPQQSLWVDAMVRVKDDLDCLFYLLSANPSLCQLGYNFAVQSGI